MLHSQVPPPRTHTHIIFIINVLKVHEGSTHAHTRRLDTFPCTVDSSLSLRIIYPLHYIHISVLIFLNQVQNTHHPMPLAP